MNVSSSRGFVQVRSAVLAGMLALGPVSGSAANPERERCGSSHASPGCIRPLNADERAALESAARELLRREPAACRTLGSFVLRHAGDARIVPYPIRTPYGSATGDAHEREQRPGTGRVHAVDSVLVRDLALARPLQAKITTLLHDFAHLAMELPQADAFLGEDLAATLAARCLRE